MDCCLNDCTKGVEVVDTIPLAKTDSEINAESYNAISYPSNDDGPGSPQFGKGIIRIGDPMLQLTENDGTPLRRSQSSERKSMLGVLNQNANKVDSHLTLGRNTEDDQMVNQFIKINSLKFQNEVEQEAQNDKVVKQFIASNSIKSQEFKTSQDAEKNAMDEERVQAFLKQHNFKDINDFHKSKNKFGCGSPKSTGGTPLHKAVELNDRDMILILLKKEAYASKEGGKHVTPAQKAAELGVDPEIISSLSSYGSPRSVGSPFTLGGSRGAQINGKSPSATAA